MGGEGEVDRPRQDVLPITQHAQVRAFDHPMRHRIVARLGQGPATVKVLAEEFGRPPGTVGHHTKVLEDAGLIEVVRTREVNGITERWLGRTASSFQFPDAVGDERKTNWMLEEFARAQADATANGREPDLLTVRIARIDEARAREWYDRLLALAVEFAEQPVRGEASYTVVLGITGGTGFGDEQPPGDA